MTWITSFSLGMDSSGFSTDRTAVFCQVITVNIDFVSCMSDGVFLSFKQNLIQMHCSLKLAIWKSCITVNMHKRNTHLEVMQKVMTAKCIRLTHKIVKTPSDRNLYYLLFSFLMASFGTSENAFTIQEFEQNIVLL